MAVLDVQPFVMKNAIIMIGADDFAMAVSSATLTPSGGTTPFKGLKPSAVFTFPQSVTWTLDLEYAQDWSNEVSLSRYLFDHIGEILDCTVNVDDLTAGTTSWDMQIAVTAGASGGAVDAVAVATVSLGVQGAPVPTTIPTTP